MVRREFLTCFFFLFFFFGFFWWPSFFFGGGRLLFVALSWGHSPRVRALGIEHGWLYGILAHVRTATWHAAAGIWLRLGRVSEQRKQILSRVVIRSRGLPVMELYAISPGQPYACDSFMESTGHVCAGSCSSAIIAIQPECAGMDTSVGWFCSQQCLVMPGGGPSIVRKCSYSLIRNPLTRQLALEENGYLNVACEDNWQCELVDGVWTSMHESVNLDAKDFGSPDQTCIHPKLIVPRPQQISQSDNS